MPIVPAWQPVAQPARLSDVKNQIIIPASNLSS